MKNFSEKIIRFEEHFLRHENPEKGDYHLVIDNNLRCTIFIRKQKFFGTCIRLSKYLMHVRMENERLDNYFRNNLNSTILH